MTTATALRIARDEWPALRWRYMGSSMVIGAARGQPSVIVDAFWECVSTLSLDWLAFDDTRSLRRALRAARYALADV